MDRCAEIWINFKRTNHAPKQFFEVLRRFKFKTLSVGPRTFSPNHGQKYIDSLPPLIFSGIGVGAWLKGSRLCPPRISKTAKMAHKNNNKGASPNEESDLCQFGHHQDI